MIYDTGSLLIDPKIPFVLLNPGDDLTSAFNSGKDVLLTSGIFTLNVLSSIVSNITIEGIGTTIIDGGNTLNVDISNLQNVIFRNITFRNIKGFILRNCANVRFINCTLQNTLNYGFFITSPINLEFDKCYIANIGTPDGINPSPGLNQTSMGSGIYISGGDNVKITRCEIQKTFGHGGIFIANGTTNLKIDSRNRIHDTFYRGITLYAGSPTGNIEDNEIWNCGSINNTTSGIGCNGIYSSASSVGVNVRRNEITNVLENGIDGQFGFIEENFINGTGIDLENHPTPSTDGIYMSNNGSYNRNTIKNSAGCGLKRYSTDPISNIQVFDNIIIDDNPNPYSGVNINTRVSLSNIAVIGNKVRNKASVVDIVNKPQTNLVYQGNISF